ncbi:MAG: cytochrome b [Steroidobacteraceae bacterium]
MLSNSEERYGSMSIALHWAMLLLIAAVYACIELRVNFPKGSETREALKHWHFMLGLAVLLLVVVRLGVNLYRRPKAPNLPARLGHAALYLFMIGMPIAGWLILSAEGEPVPFFGLELPPLMAPDEVLGKSIEELHETVGTIGYWLVGLHAAAALLHHYVLRDDTLRRMLPLRRS